MKLVRATVERFQNIVGAQTFEVESDVTGLVGKNESGKTTVLKALHRLNPANGPSHKFDLVTEYPRWRLSRDRRKENLEEHSPIVAEFAPDIADRDAIADHLPTRLPDDVVCIAERTYGGDLYVSLRCTLENAIHAAASDVTFTDPDIADVLQASSIADAQTIAKELARKLKAEDEPLRAKSANAFALQIVKYAYLLDDELTDDVRQVIISTIPKFFYFANYQVLPGECDLTALAEKQSAGEQLTAQERTVVALLDHAGEKPSDFMESDYDSRKAELQAASADLSRQVFQYWKQNPDLAVVFDTDNVNHANHPQGGAIMHRILKIELRDDRHGGVETNFSTRSTGFNGFSPSSRPSVPIRTATSR